MNRSVAIISLILTVTPWLCAQDAAQAPDQDQVQSAIEKFMANRKKKPNEVTVVLPPPDEAPTPQKDSEEPKPEPTPATPTAQPVLVTGKPPAGVELVKPQEEAETPKPTQEEPQPTTPPTPPEEPKPKPRKGMEVRVEKLQTGTGTIDPSQVKILAPFPAKPLAEPPSGWHLEAPDDTPPFTREVELSPGKRITLTIRPHLLVPDTDTIEAFTTTEPGFDPSLGYRQNTTVSAILSKSIQQMDEDSKQLGTVIDQLQQFLVSLPKPEPKPEPKPAPAPEPAANPPHKPKR